MVLSVSHVVLFTGNFQVFRLMIGYCVCFCGLYLMGLVSSFFKNLFHFVVFYVFYHILYSSVHWDSFFPLYSALKSKSGLFTTGQI